MTPSQLYRAIKSNYLPKEHAAFTYSLPTVEEVVEHNKDNPDEIIPINDEIQTAYDVRLWHKDKFFKSGVLKVYGENIRDYYVPKKGGKAKLFLTYDKLAPHKKITLLYRMNCKVGKQRVYYFNANDLRVEVAFNIIQSKL